MALERFEWNGQEAEREIRRRAVAILTEACILVTRSAKRLLSVPGTGRIKGRKVGRVTHSAPGEPPFKQTGRLRASVTYEVDAASLTARAGTNVEYGRYLELGTKNGLAPRPWLRRALAEVSGRVNALIAEL